jgi:hypothetical protein
MACAIIEGYILDCKQGAAGIKNLYFAEYGNVSSVTTTSGVTSAITMVAGKKFYTYQVRPEAADFKYSGKISLENGTDYYESTVELPLYKMTAKNRNIIDLLKQNRLVCIVEPVDPNLSPILLGELRGGDVTAIDGGTGKAMGDMNGAKVVITFKENNAPTTYSGSLATITS